MGLMRQYGFSVRAKKGSAAVLRTMFNKPPVSLEHRTQSPTASATTRTSLYPDSPGLRRGRGEAGGPMGADVPSPRSDLRRPLKICTDGPDRGCSDVIGSLEVRLRSYREGRFGQGWRVSGTWSLISKTARQATSCRICETQKHRAGVCDQTFVLSQKR